MARLRNFVAKNSLRGFRAVLFRMVSKRRPEWNGRVASFRAVLFRMVSKLRVMFSGTMTRFRAVLFRMVSKLKFFRQLL